MSYKKLKKNKYKKCKKEVHYVHQLTLGWEKMEVGKVNVEALKK